MANKSPHCWIWAFVACLFCVHHAQSLSAGEIQFFTDLIECVFHHLSASWTKTIFRSMTPVGIPSGWSVANITNFCSFTTEIDCDVDGRVTRLSVLFRLLPLPNTHHTHTHAPDNSITAFSSGGMEI